MGEKKRGKKGKVESTCESALESPKKRRVSRVATAGEGNSGGSWAKHFVAGCSSLQQGGGKKEKK